MVCLCLSRKGLGHMKVSKSHLARINLLNKAGAAVPAEPEQEHNMKRFDFWLQKFGEYLDGSGRRSELAQAIGISPQSVTRYFVARTHELPARVWIKALIWQDECRGGYRYRQPPDESFQHWTIKSAAMISKTGKKGAA